MVNALKTKLLVYTHLLALKLVKILTELWKPKLKPMLNQCGVNSITLKSASLLIEQVKMVQYKIHSKEPVKDTELLLMVLKMVSGNLKHMKVTQS
jgi:hypothetical protein